MQTRLALLGAGKIGDAIVNLLGGSGDYALTIVDRDAHAPRADGARQRRRRVHRLQRRRRARARAAGPRRRAVGVARTT